MKIIKQENVKQLISDLILSNKKDFYIENDKENYDECIDIINKHSIIEKEQIISHFDLTDKSRKFIWIRKGIYKDIIICFSNKNYK